MCVFNGQLTRSSRGLRVTGGADEADEDTFFLRLLPPDPLERSSTSSGLTVTAESYTSEVLCSTLSLQSVLQKTSPLTMQLRQVRISVTTRRTAISMMRPRLSPDVMGILDIRTDDMLNG